MFFGDPDFDIGASDWYVGSWTAEAINQSDAFPEFSPDVWLYRNSAGRVITGLDFQSLSPNQSVSIGLRAQYRGFRPVKVTGFYISEIDAQFYRGTQSPLVDKNDLIRWADHFTKGETPPGTPGLEISQTRWSDEVVVTSQVKSGSGDSPSSVIEYIGHENGILDRDQYLEISLRITAPSDVDKEILAAGRFNFGLDIGYIELPPQLQEQLVGQGCADV